MSQVYQCDNCKKLVKKDDILNWIEIDYIGTHITFTGQPPLFPVMFCTERCLVIWIRNKIGDD